MLSELKPKINLKIPMLIFSRLALPAVQKTPVPHRPVLLRKYADSWFPLRRRIKGHDWNQAQ